MRLSNRRRPAAEAILAGALCLLAAGLASLLVRHQTGLSGDEPYYERMAVHPGGPHNFPYAFRVGLPLLVHLLPLPHRSGWELLALLAAGVAGGALFALVRRHGLGAVPAAVLCVAFALSPPVLVILLRNGRGVDVAAIAVVSLGCLCIVTRQRLALALVLLAGATVHESCLFVIPLAYALWARRPLDRAALRDTVLVAAAPLVLYLLLRSSIVAVGERYQPGYTGPFLQARVDVWRDALEHGGWLREIRRLALDYGPLWLVAPLAVGRLPFARRGLVLMALCLAATTFALDWGRIFFFAAPVLYVSAAWVLRHRRRLLAVTIGLLLAMDLGYAIYMQVHGVTHGLNSSGPPARGPVY